VRTDQEEQEEVGIDDDASRSMASQQRLQSHAARRIFIERTCPVCASTLNTL
jgi:hypothetical protein